MMHSNEHRVTSMAKDRIAGFHQEAEARQLARQAQAGRTRFHIGGMIARFVRLPFALAVQFVERPIRNVAFNGAVKFLALLSRKSGATRETTS